MEYIFGTEGQAEVLRTKDVEHSHLTGYHEIKREYMNAAGEQNSAGRLEVKQVRTGQVVIDNFRVVRKIRSAEDRAGNCYDWYEIDHHYRTTDKSRIVAAASEQRDADIEDAICELDERITALEEAGSGEQGGTT